MDKLLDQEDKGIKVMRIIRLGTRDKDNIKPRLMRVQFDGEHAPKLILSRLWRLKGMKIHVRVDMDPAKRQQLQTAVVELKKRQADGEQNLHIVNFRVVKKKLFINRPILLTARPQI